MTVPKIRLEFVRLMNEYLQMLGWTQSELARNADISPSQVSGWLGKHDRSIGRDDVSRVAWAIAGGFDQQKLIPKKSLEGKGNLETTLSNLLRAAGYSPTLEPNLNQRWIELGSQELSEIRVGWFVWKPFATRPTSPSGTGFVGPWRAVIEETCHLLRVRLLPVEITPADIEAAIRTRHVDIITPIVRLPWRAHHLLFSQDIPCIMTRVTHPIPFIPEETDGEIGSQLPISGTQQMALPMAFAVHDTELELCHAVNEAIRILEKNRLFDSVLLGLQP